MKLLSSVLPRGGRLLAGGGFTLAVCVLFVGLEVYGRHAKSDFHDGLAATALLIGVLAVAARHRRAPLGWVRSLGGFGGRVLAPLAGLRYDHGIDLRGTPPVPRRTPPAVWAAAAALGWAALAAAAWAAFPTGWRVVGVYSSYTAYLAVLLCLWAALLVVTFVGVFVPVAVLDKMLKRWWGEADRRGAELLAVVGYAILISAVAWVVPPAAVLGLCLLAALGAWAAYLPGGGDGAAVLWRAGPDRPVYAVPVRRVLALVALLASLLVFAILLTACGGRLFGPPAEPERDRMPLTALFGAVAAWFVPGLMAVLGLRVWTARRNDPARRTPPTAHVSGDDPAGVRRAAAAVRGWGWKVRPAPAARAAGEVGVEVVPAERSEATEFDPRWPLRVSAEDVEGGAVRPRLERRDEIAVRRQLFRGLKKLFKRASAFKNPGGGGFWLAPHWWFVEGVGREDADAGGDPSPPLVGPPYSRAIPPRARQHAHAILRATQVDMVFVEDGVTFKALERVLRVVAEVYDVHGGRRRAEEQHFRGLPKVRVMIHEYEPGNPFRSDVYPEPKFDDLSRVRVLHVFRDRGGDEERVDPPADFSSSPAPMLVG